VCVNAVLCELQLAVHCEACLLFLCSYHLCVAWLLFPGTNIVWRWFIRPAVTKRRTSFVNLRRTLRSASVGATIASSVWICLRPRVIYTPSWTVSFSASRSDRRRSTRNVVISSGTTLLAAYVHTVSDAGILRQNAEDSARIIINPV